MRPIFIAKALLALDLVVAEAQEKLAGTCDAYISYLADCQQPDNLKDCLAYSDDQSLDSVFACLTYTHCTLEDQVSLLQFANIWRNRPQECGNTRRHLNRRIQRQNVSKDPDSRSVADNTMSVDKTAETMAAMTDESNTHSGQPMVTEITQLTASSSAEATSLISTTSTTAKRSNSLSAGSTTTRTSEEIGASCYSTTVYRTSVCPVQSTNGQMETLFCTPTSATSSTCAPNMLCATHRTYGYTICMEKNDEIGIWGIIIGSCMGGAVACCIASLIFLYYSDKRKLQRRLAEREHCLTERHRA